MIKRIALFASGSGTNVENIVDYFAGNEHVEVTRIFCNNKNAYVLDRAKQLGISTIVFSKDDFYNTDKILDQLKKNKIDLIVLAGFLLLMPDRITDAYENRMVNIHPSLLPKYGGKGMYGDKVHEAVVANNEKESGITIHYVNRNYDKGKVIIQVKCLVEPSDTSDDVANKVHALEYEHFPKEIEKLLNII